MVIMAGCCWIFIFFTLALQSFWYICVKNGQFGENVGQRTKFSQFEFAQQICTQTRLLNIIIICIHWVDSFHKCAFLEVIFFGGISNCQLGEHFKRILLSTQMTSDDNGNIFWSKWRFPSETWGATSHLESLRRGCPRRPQPTKPTHEFQSHPQICVPRRHWHFYQTEEAGF